MNSKKFPANDDGEQHDAHWYAEQAMQPRTKDGMLSPFIYLIPVEDAPTRDGLVSPFIRLIQAAEPSRIKDGLEEPLCFPHWRTDMKGPVSPIFSDADFEGGKIPEDLEYCPGHEEWGIMPNGERFRRVVYSDPVLNLSPMDQESLRRGRELEEREALTYTPPPGLPSYQPAPYISGAMPPQFVLPVHVWSHNDGMVATSDDKSELLSNYSVGVKERHVVVEREEQKREEVVLEVNCNGERYLLTVKAEELGHLAPIISKRFPSCHTNEDASKASARIENYIREQLSSVPKVTIIRSPGFFQIGKCWVYAHDAAISPDPSIVFKTGHHIGFAKDEAWWLLPSEVFAKVARYWKEQGVVFPLKSGKVHALLAGKTLIRTTQENRQGKLKQMYLLKSTLEGRPRMLVLYVDQARKYLELKTN